MLGSAQAHSDKAAGRSPTHVDRHALESAASKDQIMRRMVEPRGIEPLTSAMPLQRSPS
jgi:hypothetical protein